jgi:hypothetical protein
LSIRGTFKMTRKNMDLGKWRLKASASPLFFCQISHENELGLNCSKSLFESYF